MADSKETLEEIENKKVVVALYEALSLLDVDKVQKLLASDLEWWYHGPPSQQYLMHLLTGITHKDSFKFKFTPQTTVAFGSTVISEGFDPIQKIAWIHAWTVSNGIITQVKEYFNTSLTVNRFKTNEDLKKSNNSGIRSLHCPLVWESTITGQLGESVPGHVLAI